VRKSVISCRGFPYLLVATVLIAACSGSDPAGPPVSGALRFTLLAAGYTHSCGLGRSRIVYCWGGNAVGTLGDGTRVDRARPGAVAGNQTFRALDAGAAHNCALDGAGAAWCWGQNDEGQLGEGSFNVRAQPTAVTGAHGFAQISAGHAHTCALTPAGTAYCWGDDSQGQLGDGDGGTAPKSPVPVRVLSDQSFVHIEAGYYQTCALTTAGAAYCWGLGSSGQNGDGSTESRTLPVPVSGGYTFSELAAGDRFVCGVAGGGVRCWGALSDDSVPSLMPDFPPLHALAGAMGASTIPGASAYACALRANGTPWCWGGAVRALRSPGAEPLTPAVSASSLTAGAQHVCLLSSAGYAYCGGANYAGQLGDGTHSDRAELIPVMGPEAGS
jgi:alpha-tubulin suppressor-like RCC1 family protein